MILELVEHGLLIWPTIEENEVTRTKKYVELSATEKIQADCDLKANNIILQVNQQTHLAKFHLIDSGLVVPVFKQGDDPIDAINKMMSFLSTVVLSRFPTTNNQLRNSSNSRQQVTIHDGRCPKPKRKRDATWFRDKVLLVETQGNGKVLNEEEMKFLADPGIAEDVLSEAPHSENTPTDMLNQSVQEMSYSEQTHLVNYPEDEIHSDSNIIPYSQYLIESQNATVQDTNFFAQQDEKNAQFADFEKEINYLKQTLSEQSKEKELLTKTFNVFKNESKEKEANIDTKISLEKKVKELDNIVSLGFQNPFYLKKAQQIRPMLYDGNVIVKETNVISIADSEETLMLEEER
ncbi:hypothetical protein Tco_0969561 [Tanacetum coccineum]